jgi:hypothetical protein
MYRIITPSGPAAWTGTLHDCLYSIAHRLAPHNGWKSVTAAQAVAAGYSIVKAEAA